MDKPEFVLENVLPKILWDLVIETDHSIPDRGLHQEFINKEEITNRLEDFAVSVDNIVQIKESEKKSKYLNFAGGLKKSRETWKWRKLMFVLLELSPKIS